MTGYGNPRDRTEKSTINKYGGEGYNERKCRALSPHRKAVTNLPNRHSRVLWSILVSIGVLGLTVAFLSMRALSNFKRGSSSSLG